MANYKGHITGGAVTGAVIVGSLNFLPTEEYLPSTQQVLQDWQFSIGLLVVSILFAIWPDVDTNSKAQNLFYSIGFVLNIFLILNGEFVLSALLGMLAMTPIVGKHRGWTHSKIAMLLIPTPILVGSYLNNDAIGPVGLLTYIVAVGGYFSHLLLDGLIWKRIRVKN